MALNSTSANSIFQPIFEDFKLNHDCLSAYANTNRSNFENIFPRELRLFRVRLRLAIGLNIGFNEDFAMVKNEPTKKAYVEIMRCNEAWYAYEAMKKMCEIWNLKKANCRTPVDIFDAATLNNFNIISVLEEFNNQLQNQIYSKSSVSTDISNYINFLIAEVDSNSLKQVLQPIISKFATMQNWEHKEILAVIYATRNVFVHKGETAKSGIKCYKNKTTLLKILYDYIILFQLKVVNYAFEQKISQFDLTK